MAKLPTSDARARRFRLRMPLQYRGVSSDEWRSGTTEDISLSGVLFRASEAIEPRSPIEFSLLLPRQLSGPLPVRVFGKGYVVRTARPKFGLGHPRIAAVFAQLRLPPSDTVKVDADLRLAAQHRIFNALSIILGNSELLLDRKDLITEVRTGLSRVQSAALVIAAGVRELLQ